jgi:hypothetical protein
MTVPARLFTTLFLLGAIAPFALSDTIASATAGGGTLNNSAYLGQDFITSGGGPWTNVTFNFYTGSSATNPQAAGTAFLLNQQYLGTPNNLNNSTPGYLDSTSTINSGEYVFDSGLVLQPNTHYWLYENALINPSGGPNNTGVIYYSNGANSDYTTAADSANYLVTGTKVSGVPEPTTLALLASAFPAGWLLRRRYLKRA